MRTALVLLFLLALAAVPGLAGPAARHRRRRGSRSSPASTRTSTPWLRPARAVRRLRLAVVRRDLPAAVRLARRLRRCRAAGRTARPCAPGRRARRATCDRLPVARVVPSTADAATRCSTRPRARCAARGYRVDVATTDARRRREGLPARDRQPGLPPRAARAARRRRHRAPVRLQGRRDRRRGRGVLQHRLGLRHLRRRARWLDDDVARAVHGRRSTTSTVRYQPSGHAARRAARLRGAASATRRRPGRAEPRSVRPAGQPPADRRRHQGLPARPRLRPGRSRCATATGSVVLTRRRCRSCRRTATSPRSASSRSPARSRSSSASRASSCPPRRSTSARPDLDLPRRSSCRAALLSVYAGDLGLDSGAPQSVYTPRHRRA